MAAPKSYRAFLDALGERESNGNYGAVNTLGYLGKYQFGELALIDVGYYEPDGTAQNDWKPGFWTGKDGVRSKDDFLSDPAAQEGAIRAYMKLQWSYLGDARAYEGQKVHGIKITESGLLAAAHLLGAGTVRTFLQSNGRTVPADAYGTPLAEYFTLFKGYATPFTFDHGGPDTLSGGVRDDVLRGRGGDDRLHGRGGDDVLKGGRGDDVLDGGRGSDLLVGGRGSDEFRFTASLVRGEVDTIRDFKPGRDTIVLDSRVFKALDKGALEPDAFARGKAARDGDDHILYHRKSGALCYDANGDAPGGVTKFAILPKRLDLQADDFLVI